MKNLSIIEFLFFCTEKIEMKTRVIFLAIIGVATSHPFMSFGQGSGSGSGGAGGAAQTQKQYDGEIGAKFSGNTIIIVGIRRSRFGKRSKTDWK